MTVQYCSDLHLEFKQNRRYLINNPITPNGSILLLAGDIMPFTELTRYAWFIDQLGSQYEAVYWVPGNHEYYGSDVLEKGGSFKEALRSNVFLVNNVSVRLDKVKLIFSTLWSSISPLMAWDIQRGMADYRTIRYGHYKFRPFHCTRLHHKSVAFMEQELAGDPERRKVVVTHHVPTLLHYPPEYKWSTLNEAFATELFDLIEQSGIDYWIYGHHHRNIPDFEIGKTRLLTNQLGYVQFGEQGSFRRDAVIEL